MPRADRTNARTDPTFVPDEASMLVKVLTHAAPRPTPESRTVEKTQYAVRFADKAAELIANDLQPRMQGIEATTKRGSTSARGKKQLDINFSTPSLGLALGISLKSVHIREGKGAQRYTHNMKRNEEELRIEAAGYHKRQPYAVMVGVLFLPMDSCTDGKLAESPSSFGSWVRHLRPYTDRTDPSDDLDRFERLYIALYDPEDADLGFFDVRAAPPKNSRPIREGDLFPPTAKAGDVPRRLLLYGEFLDEIYHLYLRRNSQEFEWQDGEMDPLAPEEIDPSDENV